MRRTTWMPWMWALAVVSACGGPDTTDPTGTTDEDCVGVVTELEDGSITSDATWSCTVRYQGDLRIQEGATLTLDPCTRIELGPSSRVFVRDQGRLVAVGTEACPITFTSSSEAPVAGDWRTFDLDDTAENSQLEHVIFEYGGGSGPQIAGTGLFDLTSVTVRDVADVALELDRGRVVALTDITVERSADYPLVLLMDDVETLDGLTVSELGEPAILASSRVPLTVDSVWDDEGIPYAFEGTANVEANLDVAEGVTLWMTADSRAFVRDGGTLDLLGTEAAPVVIESAAETPFPGDWRHIVFDNTGGVSAWSHAAVRHGGATGVGAVRIESDNRVSFDTVVFEDNLDCDVETRGHEVPATDTTFTDCE